VVTAALGHGLWQQALAAPRPTGGGAYGPLGAPDANGIRLPAGFCSRVVATSGSLVPGTAYPWHSAPDGGATFGRPDGGWTYVSNSEVPAVGGAGAVAFGPDGAIVDAYRILVGTSVNCAGGPTPWATWLSCEEHDAGLVWECDPGGRRVATPLPALGAFKHEAVAVDPLRRHLYLTEDQPDGRFYRFTPTAYPSLAAGRLEVAAVGAGGAVTWLAVPQPQGGALDPTRRQVPGSTALKGGEGCWYHQGTVYLTTKGDNRVWALDTTTSVLTVVYDAASSPTPILTGVDNVTVAQNGDVLVAEDGGDMQVCLLRSGVVSPLLQVVGQDGSEITGPAFDPSGSRLYFSSQRGPAPSGTGITYEVSGPFAAPTRRKRTAPR
jgi:secreted PhoX family phosphatase